MAEYRSGNKEIRRVPHDWDHPVWGEMDVVRYKEVGIHRPTFDECISEALEDWNEARLGWGSHPNYDVAIEFVDYIRPPLWYQYNPDFDKQTASCYLIYEIDSIGLGVPIGPVCDTLTELIEHLLESYGGN